MNPIPKFKERIVAFVDILGFRTYISSLSSHPELHGRIHYALTHIKSYRSSSLSKNSALSNFEVSVFSDSIAISSEQIDAWGIIRTCGWLQAQLLCSGILTRGGISIGPTIHEDGVLYGEGMLRAYKIESSAAVYPRVVIDPVLLPRLNVETKNSFLDQDFDGMWFIDPFKFDAVPGSAEDLAADGYNPREAYFEEVGRHIALGTKGAKKVDHLAKWNWLAHRYRIACDIFSNRALQPPHTYTKKSIQ